MQLHLADTFGIGLVRRPVPIDKTYIIQSNKNKTASYGNRTQAEELRRHVDTLYNSNVSQIDVSLTLQGMPHFVLALECAHT